MEHDDTGRSSGVLLVDCDSCTGRPHACAECVVSVLLGVPDAGVVAASLLTVPARLPQGAVPTGAIADRDRSGVLDEVDLAALSVLARAGLGPRVLTSRDAAAVGVA